MLPLPPPARSGAEQQLHSLTRASVVRPTWFSAHSQALVALKEVDHVHVTASGPRKQRVFMVETFRAPASKNRIPTNTQRLQAEEPFIAQQEQPAVSIARSYDDFVELHHQTYRCIHEAHEAVQCAFCDEVMSELIGSSATPNLVTKLLIGDARVAQRLTKFLNFMLEATKNGCGALKSESACLGVSMAPVLLHDFIMGQELASAATAGLA
ncbi:hypothetical protein Gpo141_00010593 [Globisporangium polare]